MALLSTVGRVAESTRLQACIACVPPYHLQSVASLTQGLFTTMVRNVPANAVYLGSFEVLKNKAAAYKEVSVPELPAGYVLGSAALGGIMYWCAIYPIDVCKSAIMTVSRPAPPRVKFPALF